jgi:adenosylmethionine-8-amino-7-oxononanoate aminotransferase
LLASFQQNALKMICKTLARRGVLTRPVGNVIVLMPPYCATPGQVRRIVHALSESIRESFAGKTS